VYDAAAALLGCQPEEIAIVENATRAWDMAFYAVPLGPGDRILTAMAEYASNYIAFLQVARKTGATVEVIPNDDSGQLSVEALRRAIDDRVRLIAITHVPTNGGLVNSAAAVGEVAREARVFVCAARGSATSGATVPGFTCGTVGGARSF
jgi:selenocysteine lyase/cysteine desulfurase